MLYGQYVSIRDIIDGTAHAVMISEDSSDPPLDADMQWISGYNVFDVSGPINTAMDNDLHSKHPGGVNGLFADGNARFLSRRDGLENPRRHLHPQRRRNGGRFLSKDEG